MTFVVAPDSLGTPEAAWRASPRLAALPAMDWDGVRRLVVVAPHPDDEVLGVGGTMRRLHAAGVALHLVAVTDGEASHPGSLGLAERRRDETLAGLERLGLSAVATTRLGVPDGAVAAHRSTVAEALVALLGVGDRCLATWRHDRHPDHEAVGRAAAVACRRSGARLVEYPVWAWHWAEPDGDDLPWGSAGATALDEADLVAKARAVEAHASQVEGGADGPVLPPEVLAHFARSFEVVFT